MKGIEQAQLLAAVHAVEGVVDIEHDAVGRLPERSTYCSIGPRPKRSSARAHQAGFGAR
jgi:hypothetical protein